MFVYTVVPHKFHCAFAAAYQFIPFCASGEKIMDIATRRLGCWEYDSIVACQPLIRRLTMSVQYCRGLGATAAGACRV